MIRLFASESHGMGVWDGEHEHTLAVEDKRINTRPSKFAPPPAPEGAVTFKDKALARLVVLERGVRKKRNNEEWLPVILEAAQEMDLLTDALLSNLESSGQQATLSWDFQRNTMWWRCPARCEHHGFAGKHWSEGEMLCWSDATNMLTIFGGQRTLTSGDTQNFGYAQNFVEVWIGDQGSHLISRLPNQPRPQRTAEQHVTQLTWSEAVNWCTEWFKSTIFVCSPSKDVTPVMKMFLRHRREKLIKALCLAWSKNDGGRTATPSEGVYLQSIVSTLEEKVKGLTQENKSLRSASESYENDLKAAAEKIRKEVEKNAALIEENYALRHAEKMDKKTYPWKGLTKGSRHDGSAKSSSQTNGSQELLKAQREADAYKEELSRARAKLVHLETALKQAESYKQPSAGTSGPLSPKSTEEKRRSIVKNLRMLYLNHFLEGGAHFGKCVKNMVSEQLALAQQRYDEALGEMAGALGAGKSQMDNVKAAFNHYCEMNWRRVFAEGATSARCNQSMQTDGKVDEAEDQPYDPFNFGGGGIVHLEDVDPQSQSSLAVLRACIVSEFSNDAVEEFQTCFDDMWDLTVIMLLQDPLLRFGENYPIFGRFNEAEHQPVSAGSRLAQGQQVVTIIPPVVRLTENKPSGGYNGSLKRAWTVHTKAYVAPL